MWTERNCRKEIDDLKQSFDGWIKDTQPKLELLELSVPLVNENVENIQHNYELIFELKDRIEELKRELQIMKLVQVESLKMQMEKEK